MINKAINEERTVISGNVSIGATVAFQDNEKVSPAIVIVMGTGDADRDGNKKRFITNIYKDLSDAFVNHGFVCVRYDKRGTFETEGDYNTAGLSDLVDDAVSVVQYTKKLSYVDSQRVIICGHSEGAMIATIVQEKEKLAGLILLGGAGISLKDALLYQNRLAVREFEHKKGFIGWLVRLQLSEEKADKKVNSMFQKCMQTKKQRVFFAGAMLNAKWLREHGGYSSDDFIKRLIKYTGNVLAITGTADLSTDYHTLEAFKEYKHIFCYAPEGVNHILRRIDDDNSMITVMKQYQRLSKQPFHAETMKVILDWLEKIKL